MGKWKNVSSAGVNQQVRTFCHTTPDRILKAWIGQDEEWTEEKHYQWIDRIWDRLIYLKKHHLLETCTENAALLFCIELLEMEGPPHEYSIQWVMSFRRLLSPEYDLQAWEDWPIDITPYL